MPVPRMSFPVGDFPLLGNPLSKRDLKLCPGRKSKLVQSIVRDLALLWEEIAV